MLGNIGCFIAYKMSADDALIVSREMDAERVAQSDFVSLHPHHCYVKVDSDLKSFPAFSMRSLPPPPSVTEANESLRLIMEGMLGYTVDWHESRLRIEAEVKAQMAMQGGSESSSGIGFVSQRGGKGGGRKGGGGGKNCGEAEGGEAEGAGEGAAEADAAEVAGELLGEMGLVDEWGGGPDSGGDDLGPAVSSNGVHGAGDEGDEVVAASAPAGDERMDVVGEVAPGVVPGGGANGVDGGDGEAVPFAGPVGVVSVGVGRGWLPEGSAGVETDDRAVWNLEVLGRGEDIFDGVGEAEVPGSFEAATLEDGVVAPVDRGAVGLSVGLAGGEEPGGEGRASEGRAPEEASEREVPEREEPGEEAPEPEAPDEWDDDGGGGETASEARRRREGQSAPFNEYGMSPSRKVGEGTSLRRLDATKIEGSRYSWEGLEELAEHGDDPGVQEVFRKIFAGWHRAQMGQEWRKGRDVGREEGRREALAELKGSGEAVAERPSVRDQREDLLGSVVNDVIG